MLDGGDLKQLLSAAEEAARLGGGTLLAWRSRFSVTEKGRNDLLTDADIAAQETVQSFLARRFPSHAFLGEESKQGASLSPASQQPAWIVDPLDGTTNYAHGIPVFATSVGLVVDGQPMLGAVFDPQQEMFRGGPGLGAWLGTQPLQPTRIDRLADALLSTGFPPDLTGHEHMLEAWRHFSLRAQSLRRTGCTSLNLAYVAAGRHDGFWTQQAWPWDAAAGVALIRAAGGLVTNLDGSTYDLFTLDIVASNGPLHPALLAGLREVSGGNGV